MSDDYSIDEFYSSINEEDKKNINRVIMCFAYFLYKVDDKEEFSAKDINNYLKKCHLSHSNVSKVLKEETEKKNLIKNKKGLYSLHRNKIDEFKKIFYFDDNNSMFYNEKDIIEAQNNIKKIILDEKISDLLIYRLEEIYKSVKYKMPLTAIILSGSTLEGILLYIAKKNASDFNKSKSTPKYKNSTEVKKISEWTLNDFINVAYDIGFFKTDVKKLSHDLREFRNYIHPNEELKNDYRPSIEVSKIFIQILILAINEIIEKLNEQN